MSDTKTISVIGSGSWGTAAAVLLRKNGHRVRLWSRSESKNALLAQNLENREYLPGVKLDPEMEFTADISCVADSDAVVLVTPSAAVRATAQSLAPYLADGTVVVILSKGIEKGTHKIMSDVVVEECPGARVAVMSGPSHAEEASRGVPTCNVAASDCPDTARAVQDMFMSDTFRVYTSNDMLGVELGGSVKNVIALCAGIIDGIGFGDNTKAALMTRGIREISRLGVAMGAKPDTFWGLSGIGDLIVTCTSMHSRNRRAGILLGKGKSLDETLSEVHMVVEGISCAASVYELAKIKNVDMPIVGAAYDVIYNGTNPRDAVMSLMVRTKKDEII